MPQTRRLSPVTAFALGLVALHTILRGWTLQGAWFYGDDFRLVGEARATELTWSHLVEPYDFQLMPLGRLIAWLVADAGTLSWTLVMTTTLAMTVATALACWWALASVFGATWRALALLAVYLTSAMTMPATLWWAASLNQLPWQLAFFLAVGSWVRYLRGRDWWWLTVTVAALLLGLAAYVKALLIFPVLVLLLVGWFLEGSTRARLTALLRDWWRPVGLLLVIGVGYAVVYRWWVEQPFEEAAAPAELGELAWVTLGESFVSSLVGGPWTWTTDNPPVATATPPTALIVAAWLLVAAFLIVQANSRSGVGKAVALLLAYLLSNLALLALTRAAVVGPVIGTELRYLTDTLPVAVLCLGLAAAPVPGAVGSGRELERTRWATAPPQHWTAGLLAVVLVGGVVSTISYARVWHTDHPGADYFGRALDGVSPGVDVDLADQVVPQQVHPLFAPANSTSYLLPQLSDRFSFPESTDSLVVLDDQGNLKRALIEPGVTGEPPAESPVEAGCPWPVDEGRVVVPLSGELFDWDWWALLSYAASDATPITVTGGSRSVEAELEAGFNSLYVHLPGGYDDLRISGLDPRARVCFSAVTVGNPTPGGDL